MYGAVQLEKRDIEACKKQPQLLKALGYPCCWQVILTGIEFEGVKLNRIRIRMPVCVRITNT